MTAKQNDFSAERQQRAGLALQQLDALAQGWRSVEYELLGLSIKCPRSEGDDYLVTVRALDAAGQPVVAFHGAYNLLELLIGVSNRISNGGLRWKVDEWGR